MTEVELQHLRNLLKLDSLEDVVKFLHRKIPQNEEVIQISGRLNSLRTEIIKGTLNFEETQRVRNNIRTALISIINNHNEKVNLQHTIHKHINPLPTIFFMGFLFIIIGFFVFITPKCSFPRFADSDSKKKFDIPPVTVEQEEKQVPLGSNISVPFFEEKKIIGVDNKGRIAEYVIFIVRDFNWKLGEIETSERNGIQLDICEQLKEIGVSERVNRKDYKGIICFGNTSFEEDLTIPKELRVINEEERADKRAKKLANCVSNVLTTITPVFIANVGKYKIEDELTTYQRSVILVAIIKNDEGVVNEEALFNGLEDWNLTENWEIDINEYSKVKSRKINIKRFYN